MARKVRKDKTVGALEKDLGLPRGAIRNKNGRKTRSDAQVGTLRRRSRK